MRKNLFFFLLVFVSLRHTASAQYSSVPDIGESTGVIMLAEHTLSFGYQYGHLTYLVVKENKTPQKTLVNATYEQGALSSIRTYYPNGKLRTQLSTHATGIALKDLRIIREPLLNLPLRYYLDGTCKHWSPDGNICTITRYKNNQRISDSVSTKGSAWAINDLGLDSLSFSLVNWLYPPDLLNTLQQEIIKAKLPASPVSSGIRYNPYDHIDSGLEIDVEAQKKIPGHKAFTKTLEKYRDKGELVHFKIRYASNQITGIEVESETITAKDRTLLLAHLSKIVREKGIRVNDLVAQTGEIRFYFHMGC